MILIEVLSFSYTPANENLASTFLECKQKEKNSEFSYKNEILNYLMNAEQFAEFKEKNLFRLIIMHWQWSINLTRFIKNIS